MDKTIICKKGFIYSNNTGKETFKQYIGKFFLNVMVFIYTSVMTILYKISIISGLTLCSISDGYIFGQMSGMVDDLHVANNEMALSDDDVSWIASSINVTCVIGFIISGIITERFGRKLAIIIVNLPILVMWIILYYAKSLSILLLSRIIVGASYGGMSMLSYITMVEYTTPSKRATCVNIISSVGPSIGTTLGHILCLLLHWRTVALIGIIPTGFATILPFVWVESPSWLAYKGRFAECEKSFRKLHGHSEASEAELRLLVNFEKFKQKDFASDKNFIYLIYAKTFASIKQKYIWKIKLLSSVVIIYRVAGGRILFSTLAITMLQEITGSSNILFFTLLVDGFIILGSILSCYLLKVMNLRTLLFSFGLVANIVLILLSVCLYYMPRNNLYYAWVCSSILALYFIIAYAGPYAVLEILLAETFPLELKFYMTVVIGIFAGLATFISVKLASSLFTSMGYHGVFLLNSGIVFMCLGYLWFHMPETKKKTIQEIELFFRDNKFKNNKRLAPIFEQTNSLFMVEKEEENDP